MTAFFDHPFVMTDPENYQKLRDEYLKNTYKYVKKSQ
jgi:hypothetical protein